MRGDREFILVVNASVSMRQRSYKQLLRMQKYSHTSLRDIGIEGFLGTFIRSICRLRLYL